LSFKSAFGCFKSVVVYLFCIWLLLVLFGFFKGLIWPFFAYVYLATLDAIKPTGYRVRSAW